jgi:hypothetical protein
MHFLFQRADMKCFKDQPTDISLMLSALSFAIAAKETKG